MISSGTEVMAARSSFYYKPKPESTERLKAQADLRDRMEAICLEFPRYGYRRVAKQLQHEGWTVNHKKVLRLMREGDLLCQVKQNWMKTTDSRTTSQDTPILSSV